MVPLAVYLAAHPAGRWCACGYPLPAADRDRLTCRSDVCRRWRDGPPIGAPPAAG